MTALFLVCAAFCAYTYVGFPALLWLRLRLRGVRATRAERLAERLAERPVERPGAAASAAPLGAEPLVSVVVAAHDEAARLPVKIASLDALDWPRERLDVVVVSDGSSDGTVALLEEAARVRPWLRALHYEPAAGKPTALNVGVEAARGDVLVFMDARQRVAPEAVRELVGALALPGVGAASGELLLDVGGAGGAPDAASVGLYWRYEKWIRARESELFSTTGATGALYAIRREHYVPHRPDVLLDDFDTPVRTLRRGLRTVFVPGARVFDLAEAEASGEFRRKVRTLAGNFQSFARAPWLFDPRRNPVWWQFVSHKVFRLLVPYALAGAFVAAALGDGPFLRAMLAAQLAFYGLGLASVAGLDHRVANVVRVFVQLNAAAVVGAWRWASGGTGRLWKRPAGPTRETGA